MYHWPLSKQEVGFESSSLLISFNTLSVMNFQNYWDMEQLIHR